MLIHQIPFSGNKTNPVIKLSCLPRQSVKQFSPPSTPGIWNLSLIAEDPCTEIT